MENKKNIINKLVKLSKFRIIGRLFFYIMKFLGVEIPIESKIDKEVVFSHWSNGLVIHPNAEIYKNVKIYQDVTIGRADIYIECKKEIKIIIDEGAIICAGAKILCKGSYLKVGKNTIIGANSVLLQSTGDNEIWGGNPAKLIKKRINE